MSPTTMTAAKRDQRKLAWAGGGLSSSMTAGACGALLACWVPPVANCAGENLPPSAPITPAASTIAGNGTLNAKIALNAAAAMAHRGGDLSARDPIRHAACSTIAVTAGLMP